MCTSGGAHVLANALITVWASTGAVKWLTVGQEPGPGSPEPQEPDPKARNPPRCQCHHSSAFKHTAPQSPTHYWVATTRQACDVGLGSQPCVLLIMKGDHLDSSRNKQSSLGSTLFDLSQGTISSCSKDNQTNIRRPLMFLDDVSRVSEYTKTSPECPAVKDHRMLPVSRSPTSNGKRHSYVPLVCTGWKLEYALNNIQVRKVVLREYLDFELRAELFNGAQNQD
nr:unnamed protein product [Timema tahoe]